MLMVLGVVVAVGCANLMGFLTQKKTSTYRAICDQANLSPIWEGGPSKYLGTNVDLNYPIKVVLRTQRFAIPWGYLAYPVSRERIQCGSMRDTVRLQYWIPSLDAPEAKIIYHGVDNRPKEQKRPSPRRDESVIDVFSIGMDEWLDGKLAWTIRDRNLDVGRPDLMREHGLWKTPRLNDSLDTTYWFEETALENIAIECTKAPRCNMLIDLKDMGLSAYVIFARDMVAEHRTMRAGLRTLLKRWHTPNYLPAESAESQDMF